MSETAERLNAATRELEITEEAGVRWLALNRPESKNGLTEALNASLIAAFDASAVDPAVRCVVLTGKGGSFCSGADLRAAAESVGAFENLERHLRESFHGLIRALRRLEKPVVALIDGAAVGFGCDLALACDLRLGTERARLGEVFVKRGLMPDGGGTFMLPRMVGLGKALELMFTGDAILAEELLRLGLLNRILPATDAVAETWALGKRLAKGPPLAYARIKRAVYAGLEGSFDDALEREARGQLELLRSPDFFEGVAAFFQKREPNFTGR